MFYHTVSFLMSKILSVSVTSPSKGCSICSPDIGESTSVTLSCTLPRLDYEWNRQLSITRDVIANATY